MSKYVAFVGRVRFTSEDKRQLQKILRRDRDRKVQAERERRERAIRKEVRDFLRRYQDCVFRFGSAEGLNRRQVAGSQDEVIRNTPDKRLFPGYNGISLVPK